MSDPGIAAARALISAQAAFPPVPVRLQRPATVIDFDPATSYAKVRVAGDDGTVDAVVLGASPTVGSRVMVSFEKPRGIFIGAS